MDGMRNFKLLQMDICEYSHDYKKGWRSTGVMMRFQIEIDGHPQIT